MKITKRNGAIHIYDDEKVAKSILKANANVPEEDITPAMASAMASEVFARITRENEIISTADVRDSVYLLLNERNYPGTAKSYWDYKSKK